MELAMDISSDFLSPLPLWERVARRAAASGRGVCNGRQNGFKNAVGVLQHFIIPEPQDAKPLIFQPPCATPIGVIVSERRKSLRRVWSHQRLFDRRRLAVRRFVLVTDSCQPLAGFFGLALPVPHTGIKSAGCQKL